MARYNGQPLAGQILTLTSELGQSVRAATDAQGRARITLPERFKRAEGGHRRATTRFVVATTLLQGGRQEQAAFNDHFIAPQSEGKSAPLGWGFLALGMLLGAPLLRQKSSSQNQETRP
ncbi:hypothetical protein MAIT1_03992 [Magnetofaba australis IT-1]|uniref:Uncharacterized protein n=1 Tax=Magnetofaba australis IT-1 TaxID=1434232 RepID=A0A1Y2K8M9_9PROT|nr:hypothetical protein MAIT1_03992 [Magnetofaba australis IT-1]